MQSALETDQALVEMHPLLRSGVDKLLMKLVNSPDAFFAHVQRSYPTTYLCHRVC